MEAPTGEASTPGWESQFFPAAASLALGALLMLWMNYALGVLIAVPVQFFWGRPFVAGVLRFVRGRGASMETLVGLGTLASLALSVASPHHPYFEVGVFLIGFVRLGKWLETRAKTRTGQAVRGLLSLSPPQATRLLPTGATERIAASVLSPGDRLRVLPGERIPADGKVLLGESSVDESWLTGESLPATKAAGSKVLAGSQNTLGLLEIEVTAPPAQSLLAQIIERVERAQMSRAPIQRVADQVAARFVPAVLVAAAITCAAWLAWGGTLSSALLHAVSVLVIACPCALGLATPAALVVGLGKASQQGILFKNGAALETLSRARSFVFDKTGTLTEGHPSLSATLVLAPSKTQTEWLALAAGAEQGSEHPLARAFNAAARGRGLTLRAPDKFQALPGQGIRASIQGEFELLGTAKFLSEQGIALPDEANSWIRIQESAGATPVLLAHDFKLAAVFAFKDQLRPDSRGLLAWMKQQGLKLLLLSGDRTGTALAIGGELGLAPSEIEAEVLPHQKEARIAILEQTESPVAMVGDGINDAPALARASVSVSLLGASDTALDSAQIILMSGRIQDLRKAILHSRATLRVIRQNLMASAIYNVLGIPLAAGVFEHSMGLGLTPALAGAAMALSSVSVVLNSLRLR